MCGLLPGVDVLPAVLPEEITILPPFFFIGMLSILSPVLIHMPTPASSSGRSGATNQLGEMWT
jgi:hypothetical protein